jgi:hypothetical protein
MATYAKTILSGSTDGKGIAIAQTGTIDQTSVTGTLIHTGPTATGTLHEIWLYAVNASASAAVKLTLQWGGIATSDEIELTIQPASGLVLIAPGLLIKGNATPLVVRAWATTTANVVNVHGYVNTIT